MISLDHSEGLDNLLDAELEQVLEFVASFEA